MLTNFMYPDKKKIKYIVDIPVEPELFDYFELFRLCTCFGCCIGLFILESYLLSVFVLSVCGFLTTFMVFNTIKNIRLKKRVKCLKTMKKIYETPVLVQDENRYIYTFLAPSEKLVREIMYLNRILDEV